MSRISEENQDFYQTLKSHDIPWTKKQKLATKTWYSQNSERDQLIFHCFTTALMNHDKKTKNEVLTPQDYSLIWETLADFLKSGKSKDGTAKIQFKQSFVRSICAAFDQKCFSVYVISCCEVLLKNPLIPNELLRKQPDTIFQLIQTILPALADENECHEKLLELFSDLVKAFSEQTLSKNVRKRCFVAICSNFQFMAAIVSSANERLVQTAALLLKSAVFRPENSKILEEIATGNVSESNSHSLQFLQGLKSEGISEKQLPALIEILAELFPVSFPKSGSGLLFVEKILESISNRKSVRLNCLCSLLRVVSEHNLYIPVADTEGHQQTWLKTQFQWILHCVEKEPTLNKTILFRCIPVMLRIEPGVIKDDLKKILGLCLEAAAEEAFSAIAATFAKLRQLPELAGTLVTVLEDESRLSEGMLKSFGDACETMGPMQAKKLGKIFQNSLETCITEQRATEAVQISFLLKSLTDSVNLLKYEICPTESALKLRKHCRKLPDAKFGLCAWILGEIVHSQLIIKAEYEGISPNREKLKIWKKLRPLDFTSDLLDFRFQNCLMKLDTLSWILSSVSLMKECDPKVTEASRNLLLSLETENHEDSSESLGEYGILLNDVFSQTLLDNCELLISVSGDQEARRNFSDWAVKSDVPGGIFRSFLCSETTWENSRLSSALVRSLLASLGVNVSAAFENGAEKAVWVEKYAEHVLSNENEPLRKVSVVWNRMTRKLLEHCKRAKHAGKLLTKVYDQQAYVRVKDLFEILGHIPVTKFQDQRIISGVFGALLALAVTLQGCEENLLTVLLERLARFLECSLMTELVSNLPESFDCFLTEFLDRGSAGGADLERAVLHFLGVLTPLWKECERAIVSPVNSPRNELFSLKSVETFLKACQNQDTSFFPLGTGENLVWAASLVYDIMENPIYSDCPEVWVLATSVLALLPKCGVAVVDTTSAARFLISAVKNVGRMSTEEVTQFVKSLVQITEEIPGTETEILTEDQKNLVTAMTLEKLTERYLKKTDTDIEKTCLSLLTVCTCGTLTEFLEKEDLSEKLAARIFMLKAAKNGALGAEKTELLKNDDFVFSAAKRGYLSSQTTEQKTLFLRYGYELLSSGKNLNLVVDSSSFIGFLFTFIGTLPIASEAHEVTNLEHFLVIFDILNLCLRNHFPVISNMVGCFVTIWRKWLLSLRSVSGQDGAVVSGRCYQMLTRLTLAICQHPEDFSKVAPYMVADFVQLLQELKPDMRTKKLILPGVYALLDICDTYGKAMLFTNLNPSAKEYFKLIFEEYEKFHRYKGFV